MIEINAKAFQRQKITKKKRKRTKEKEDCL